MVNNAGQFSFSGVYSAVNIQMAAHGDGMLGFNEHPPQHTRDIEPMLVQCWADVVDGGSTLT